MQEEVKNTELQKPITSGDAEIDEHSRTQYKIIEYLKGHTGLLIACVSGFFAVLSFVFGFYSMRYQQGFLAYWEIDTAYIIQAQTSQIYTVSCTFVYFLSLMIIHLFLGKTSSVFAHYNKFISLLNYRRKQYVFNRRKSKKNEKRLNKLLEFVPEYRKSSDEIENLGRDISALNKQIEEALSPQDDLEDIRRTLIKWEISNIFLNLLVPYLVVFLCMVFMQNILSAQSFLIAAVSSTLIIIGDVLVYFIPAYFATRCTKERFEQMNLSDAIADLQPLKKHVFPLTKLSLDGIYNLLTDSHIKLLAVQIITTLFLLLMTASFAGRSFAHTAEHFPIIHEEGTTYAIVYNNGSSVIAQEATIDGQTITINTSCQVVMPADNLRYQIQSFSNRIVQRLEDEK